jgi:DNA-binding NtrC family response regulator
VVALTSVDLEHAVALGSFREDLFYRLNVLPLLVPSLRERRGDVRPLAQHFLAQLAQIHRKPRLSFTGEALAALESYGYPGNVRELRNLIERAVISASSQQIALGDLPEHVRETAPASNKHRRTLAELERDYIAEILDSTRGRKGRAAEILGISRKTLLEKRKRYKLD